MQKQYLSEITTKYANDESIEKSVDFQSMIDEVLYIKKHFLVELASKIKADVSADNAKIKEMKLDSSEKRIAKETSQRKIAKKYLTEVKKVCEEYRSLATKNRDVCRRELLKEPAKTLDDLSYQESEKAIKDFARSNSLYPTFVKVDAFVKSYRKKYENDSIAMLALFEALPSLVSKIQLTSDQQKELESLLSEVERRSKTTEQLLAANFLALTDDYEDFKIAKEYSAATRSIHSYLTKYARFINDAEAGLKQIQDEENEFKRKFVDSYL